MLVALLIAAVVSGVAYALRLLTARGAVAAAFVGTAALTAGPGWLALLLFFFVTSNAVSYWRHAERDALVGALVEKGRRRDARQVVANGGVFAVAAIASTYGATTASQAIGAGAIATALADTWSTELGTVLGGTPRLMLSGHAVPPGTSGGVTLAGYIASVVAGLVAAMFVVSIDWIVSPIAVFAGGLSGSLFDSLLGATIQERRWCITCERATERRIHSCGAATTHRGGIRGCDNDVVNLISTIAGAAITWTLT